jgi:hypothetical protein
MALDSADRLDDVLHFMRNWLLPLNAEIAELTARARGQDPAPHRAEQVSPVEAVTLFVGLYPQARRHRAALITACEKMPPHQLAVSQAKWQELRVQSAQSAQPDLAGEGQGGESRSR